MVHLHGQFDSVTGRRIGSRRRTFQQCVADALGSLAASNNASGGGKPFADICVVAHVDAEMGRLIAELPDGVRLPQSVLEELSC